MPQKVTPAKSGKTPQKFGGATPAGKTPAKFAAGKMVATTPASNKKQQAIKNAKTPQQQKKGASFVASPGKTPKKQPQLQPKKESDDDDEDEDDDEFESDEFDSELESEDDAEFDSDDDDEEEDQKPPAMNASSTKKQNAVVVATTPNKKGAKANDVATPSTATPGKNAGKMVATPAGNKKQQQAEKNAKTPPQQQKKGASLVASPGKTPMKKQQLQPQESDDDEDDDDEDESEDDEDMDDKDLEDEDEDELESEEDEDEDDDDDEEDQQQKLQKGGQQQKTKQLAQNENKKRTQPQPDTNGSNKKVKANDGAPMFPEKATKEKKKAEKPEKKQKEQPLMPVKADKQLQDEIEQRKRERDRSSLFFKNLPKDTPDEAIKALSSDIQNVKRVSKAAKAGWLSFASEELCKKNYEKLKNAKINGKQIFVDYCGSKAKSPPQAGQDYQVDALKLYVGNLPASPAQEDLKKLFPSAKDIYVRTDRRFCFVTFESPESARQAFDKNKNSTIKGSKVEVSFARVYPSAETETKTKTETSGGGGGGGTGEEEAAGERKIIG